MATSSLGLLASAYGDDDDSEEEAAAPAAASAAASTSLVSVAAAPQVLDEALSAHASGMWNAVREEGKAKKQRVVYQNPEYEEMWAPMQGPSLSTHEQRAAGIQAKSTFR